MNPINGKEIIDIKNQIANNFSKSDWLDFGYSLNSYDIVQNHDRLLRSLSFGDDDYEGNILQVLTSIISKDSNNLNEIRNYLSEKYSTPAVSDFISTAHSEVPKKMISFAPQVFQIPNSPQNEKLVSVMLPFKLGATFDAIKKACDDLSLDCKKADDIWVNTTFIQDIFELIFTSHVVIADFTDKNPNVFYEVGIAHTLGKTVIPITQSIADVPSDLGHHRALKYLPNEQGYKDLTAELKKRLLTLMPKAYEF
ncbi:hypothetical protein [Spirosoma aerophilum]